MKPITPLIARQAVRYRNTLYCRQQPYSRQSLNQIELLEQMICQYNKEQIKSEDKEITSFIRNNTAYCE